MGSLLKAFLTLVFIGVITRALRRLAGRSNGGAGQATPAGRAGPAAKQSTAAGERAPVAREDIIDVPYEDG